MCIHVYILICTGEAPKVARQKVSHSLNRFIYNRDGLIVFAAGMFEELLPSDQAAFSKAVTSLADSKGAELVIAEYFGGSAQGHRCLKA